MTSKIMFITFIVISFVEICFSQNNLVLNSGFEEYSSLPEDWCKDGHSHAFSWLVPSECSPDYYHTDNTKFYYYHLPENDWGYHTPHSGKACIGICPFKWDGYMEHITGTLSQPLERGKKYKVSFYIRHAGSSSMFGITGLGVRFSEKVMLFLNYTPPFNNYLISDQIKADVESPPDLILLNDTGWVKIEGIYLAKGGEKYITLGKFYDKEIINRLVKRFTYIRQNDNKRVLFYRKHEKVLPFNPHFDSTKGYKEEAPYYFIDDVTVEPDTTSYSHK